MLEGHFGSSSRMAKRITEAQTKHDRVIALLVQKWSDPGKYNITTNPGSEKNRWVGSDANYPDIVAWRRVGSQDTCVWFAEVETEDSVSESHAKDQWAKYDSLPGPFYLVVPAGLGATARQIARRAALTIDAFFEWDFVASSFTVTRA